MRREMSSGAHRHPVGISNVGIKAQHNRSSAPLFPCKDQAIIKQKEKEKQDGEEIESSITHANKSSNPRASQGTSHLPGCYADARTVMRIG